MKALTQRWWFKGLDVRINVCYTWFMHALHMVSIHMGKSKNVLSPPPDWMADCKARARRWCGCTSAGVDPPAKDPYQQQRHDQSQPIRVKEMQRARYITLAHVQKHALNYCRKNPLPHSIRPSSPPHVCALGRRRLGHLSLNRHPAIGNDVAPHYCQQLQRSRSAAGETPFLS